MDTQTSGSTQLTTSSKKIVEQTQHFDKLGTELFPGDFIIAPYGNRQSIIAEIIKLNPKMLTIRRIGARSTANTYATETAKLDPALVTMYMLRNKIG